MNNNTIYSNLFKKVDNKNNISEDVKEEKEIKIIPRVRNFKRKRDIIKWLDYIVYDDYSRYYFIQEMFYKLQNIMNQNDFFSEETEKILFTEFVNWCYFNSYDFSI
jgi:hypothetical protein